MPALRDPAPWMLYVACDISSSVGMFDDEKIKHMLIDMSAI